LEGTKSGSSTQNQLTTNQAKLNIRKLIPTYGAEQALTSKSALANVKQTLLDGANAQAKWSDE
jgi:hypothetical protein